VRFWVRWERSRWCPSYRVNGMKGGGQGGGWMQVVGGRFKSFGYGRGRVKWMSALFLIVAYDF
jgi:hypothetical protein